MGPWYHHDLNQVPCRLQAKVNLGIDTSGPGSLLSNALRSGPHGIDHVLIKHVLCVGTEKCIFVHRPRGFNLIYNALSVAGRVARHV